MPHAPDVQEMSDLVEWLAETIHELRNQNWQLTLDAGNGVVDATLKVVQSQQTNERGRRMTITRVEKATFRTGSWRAGKTVFRTD